MPFCAQVYLIRCCQHGFESIYCAQLKTSQKCYLTCTHAPRLICIFFERRCNSCCYFRAIISRALRNIAESSLQLNFCTPVFIWEELHFCLGDPNVLKKNYYTVNECQGVICAICFESWFYFQKFHDKKMTSKNMEVSMVAWYWSLPEMNPP